jgi:hypothetical protein
VIAAATTGPSALWYLARGSGVVALLLLSASVILGILNVRRTPTGGAPRFLVDGLHRTVSLLVIVVLVIHILGSVLDSFAHIGLVGALVPFTSTYRPVWLGLGTLGFELLVAIAVTSLLRRRVGYRTWRAVHWLAYASWPIALVHGFGTGTDGKSGWMLVLSAGCVAAVVAAVLSRVAAGWPGHRDRRIAAGLVALAAPVALALWLLAGPLGSDWARRAGTPTSLLAARVAPPSPAAGPASARRTAGLAIPFTTSLTGTINQTPGSGGVVLDLRLRGGAGRVVSVRIVGQPSPGGGVAMTSGLVRLGTTGHEGVYTGPIVALAGGRLTAALTGSGRRIRLAARLAITGTAVTGSATASPDGAGA